MLCAQIAEVRRMFDIQPEGGGSMSVYDWAIAGGYPSHRQLLMALKDGERAERRMVMVHQGLVHSVARRYLPVTRNLTIEDLIQEGRVGLHQAIKHFDPTRGTRFSSYAMFRIKACMLRAIADKDRVIRVPVHIQDKAMKILSKERELGGEMGFRLTDEELAQALGMQAKTVAICRKAMKQEVSELEGDEAGQQNAEGVRFAEQRLIREDIMSMLGAMLSPVESQALRLRFGLHGSGGGGRTFQEVGAMMKLSTEGIRKMVLRAIGKLQSSDEALGLLLAYVEVAI